MSRAVTRVTVYVPVVSLWTMGMKCSSMSFGEWASATALRDSTALSLTTVSSTVARLSSGGWGRGGGGEGGGGKHEETVKTTELYIHVHVHAEGMGDFRTIELRSTQELHCLHLPFWHTPVVHVYVYMNCTTIHHAYALWMYRLHHMYIVCWLMCVYVHD